MRAWASGACLLLATACAAPLSNAPAPVAPPKGDDGRAATSSFVQVETEVLGWLSVADPRLAARTGTPPPKTVVDRAGMDAVMAEDAAGRMRGGSFDLFAFDARGRALAAAAQALDGVHDTLPDAGPVGSELRRPRLERELLGRIIEEEQARAQDEARLGGSSGDLVRGVVSTWAPPASPQDFQDRDVWIAKRLTDLRGSLRDAPLRTGPPDLDQALDPLERLLEPMQYPRGMAALAQLRVALDQQPGPVPKLHAGDVVTRAVRVHLGVPVDVVKLPSAFAALEPVLRAAAEQGLSSLDAATKAAVLAKARELLFVEGPCPPVTDSPVRSMAPPPERATVCGLLRSLADPATRLAALMALHDDVQLGFAAVTDATPPRTTLLCHPDDDVVDGLRRMARERPVVALAPLLAAQIVLGAGVSDARIDAWRDLGEVPLDVLARELGGS